MPVELRYRGDGKTGHADVQEYLTQQLIDTSPPILSKIPTKPPRTLSAFTQHEIPPLSSAIFRGLSFIPLVGISFIKCSAADKGITVGSAPPQVSEMTMFAFDDVSIPWKHNLKLTLVPAQKHPENPVLRRGPEGAPDHGHTRCSTERSSRKTASSACGIWA